MQLRMSTRQVDGVLVVDCSGRVVFGEESATLRDTVKKLLAQSPKVVLNLREVNYIDSGGLGRPGPFYITNLIARGTVKLDLPGQGERIHPLISKSIILF